jgi:hypothetical protein
MAAWFDRVRARPSWITISSQEQRLLDRLFPAGIPDLKGP